METLSKYLLGFNLTEGAIDFAEQNKCFWFLDVICSHQLNKKVRAEEFQVWKLVKDEWYGCEVICEDGNDNVVTTQKIEFTDFPFADWIEEDVPTLWLCNNVIYLPSEH